MSIHAAVSSENISISTRKNKRLPSGVRHPEAYQNTKLKGLGIMATDYCIAPIVRAA